VGGAVQFDDELAGLDDRATEGIGIFRLAVKPLTLPPLRGGPLPLSKREGSDKP
jgi:hypothetical protein